MRLRGVGGGHRVRHKVSRKWLQETVVRQQLVINALAEKLSEGRRLVQELIEQEQAREQLVKPASSLIIPGN